MILDVTVHDADTLRFVLGVEAEDVIARSARQGLAQGETGRKPKSSWARRKTCMPLPSVSLIRRYAPDRNLLRRAKTACGHLPWGLPPSSPAGAASGRQYVTPSPGPLSSSNL